VEGVKEDGNAMILEICENKVAIMPKRTAAPTVPSFRFEDEELEAIRKALDHYGAYLKATQRDSRIYEALAERLSVVEA